mgnify:CR=1 FL=1
MRSFIAINLPDPIKSDIDSIVERLRPSGPPARWVPGSILHLTLKFLDEISPDQVAPIRGAITMAVSDVQAFDVRLGGFGVFPNERKARVFWIGIEGGFETMKTLARDIDRAVEPLGNSRAQLGHACHRGVLGLVGLDGRDARLLHVRGRREVGLAGR